MNNQGKAAPGLETQSNGSSGPYEREESSRKGTEGAIADCSRVYAELAQVLGYARGVHIFIIAVGKP